MRCSRCLGVLTIAFVAISARPALADADKANGARAAAAHCATEKATILRRTDGEKDWHVVAENEELFTNDLLVGLPGGMLDSKDGAVRLKFLTALEGQSPYPI